MKLSKEDLQNIFINQSRFSFNSQYPVKELQRHIEALEQELTELKQSNLMHLEDVKELQRKLKSAAIYGNKVNRLGLQARNELILAESRANSLEVENGLLLAQVERAILDHQPVVLPKRQVIALDHLREGENSNYNIVTDLATCSWNKDQARHFNEIFDMDRNVLVTALVNGYTVEPEKIVLSKELDKAIKYAMNMHQYQGDKAKLLKVHRSKRTFHNDLYALNNISSERLEKALTEGYTVETPEDAAVKGVADMLDKWSDADYVNDVSVDDQNKAFAKEIIEFVEGIKK